MGHSMAHQVTQAIRNKASAEDVIDLLKSCPDADDDMSGNSSGFSLLAVDVFVSVLLNLGSKSFSHSFAALTRYLLHSRVE
jgi:nuclear cap-binding protein subunit 1